MTPEQWQRVKDLFDRAIEARNTNPTQALAATCDDPTVLREVERLISLHEKAGDFIEMPASEPPETQFFGGNELRPLDRIGPYQIERELGRGGMGVVYLAIRNDDLIKKSVAIKLLGWGAEDQIVLRRFQNERRILASLDHPNIAKLFDAGATDDGRPYFVMDYVEGMPIGRYCEIHN